VKKATSKISLKAIRRRLLTASLLIDGGGGPLGRIPCAWISMSVSCEEGLVMLGKPLLKGNENGAAETALRAERPIKEADAMEVAFHQLVK